VLLPEPFPTSPSGSPWGEGEVGNGGGRPPKGVFAGRRDNGHRVRAHSGHTSRCRVMRGLCGHWAQLAGLRAGWSSIQSKVLDRVSPEQGRPGVGPLGYLKTGLAPIH
jgi:hypothetical protein